MSERRMMRPAVRHDLSTRALAKVLVTVGAVWLLMRLWPILLVIVASLILVGTLNPLVAVLERRCRSRTRAVGVVFVCLMGALVCVGLLLGPPLWQQLIRFLEAAPVLQSNLADALAQHRLTASLAVGVRDFQVGPLLSGQALNALSISSAIVEVVGYTVASLVLALYLAADRDRARGALYAVVPCSFHVRLARINLRLGIIVGGYMRGQLITSCAITLFAFALLAACRVPGALALAVFAGLTDIIPFVGGLLATLPAVLAALPRGAGIAALILAAMIAYQELENRVLVPRVYGSALRLPSAAVIVALLIGGKLLGIVGALLALPIAAGLRMVVEELRIELPGVSAADSAVRERDQRAERAYQLRAQGAPPDQAAAVATAIALEGAGAAGVTRRAAG